MAREFVKNEDGVHLMNGEYTLCGDAYDIAETESDFTAGTLAKTKERTVTCERCVAIIKLCRGVQTGKAWM